MDKRSQPGNIQISNARSLSSPPLPIIIIIIIIIIIDVAISGDRTVIKNEAEKILKYKDLTIEIQRMWNVKTKVISIIIVATGIISKSFRK